MIFFITSYRGSIRKSLSQFFNVSTRSLNLHFISENAHWEVLQIYRQCYGRTRVYSLKCKLKTCSLQNILQIVLHECLLRLTKRFGYSNILKDSKNIL